MSVEAKVTVYAVNVYGILQATLQATDCAQQLRATRSRLGPTSGASSSSCRNRRSPPWRRPLTVPTKRLCRITLTTTTTTFSECRTMWPVPPPTDVKKTPDLRDGSPALKRLRRPLAERRSSHKGANLPTVYPSTVGNQGPLQRPGECL